jgi:hypothetical protein
MTHFVTRIFEDGKVESINVDLVEIVSMNPEQKSITVKCSQSGFFWEFDDDDDEELYETFIKITGYAPVSSE